MTASPDDVLYVLFASTATYVACPAAKAVAEQGRDRMFSLFLMSLLSEFCEIQLSIDVFGITPQIQSSDCQSMPPDTTDSMLCDVVVVGGGLAGLAASIHLSRAGLDVVCLEPVTDRDRIVGESLDWSAPELFKRLGLKMEALVEEGIATYKRHVSMRLHDGSGIEYVPSAWLGQPPFNIELRTLHVDRQRFDAEIRRIAAECGVREICDRAVALEWNGSRLAGITGASGTSYSARWFVDASGYASSFLGRKFGLAYKEYGPKKIGIWSYFKTPEWKEGTTLYTEGRSQSYLRWVWQIPIAPGETSVGLVLSGPSLKEQRSDDSVSAASVSDVFYKQLQSVEQLRPMLEDASELSTPRVTSFSCRVFHRVCGANWLIVGEAAAVPDPITGNGVTSALRHASEATRLILKHNKHGRLGWLSRQLYNLRVTQMCRFFDSLIEKLAYSSPLRDRFGLKLTGDIYTSIAWSMNHLYSRFQPTGAAGTVLFCSVLAAFRAATWIADRLCRTLVPFERPAADAPRVRTAAV